MLFNDYLLIKQIAVKYKKSLKTAILSARADTITAKKISSYKYAANICTL